VDYWEGPQRRRSRLSDRSRAYLAALVALVVTVLVLMLDSGANGFRFRSWLGIDDRIVSAVEPSGDGHYQFFDTQPGSREPVAWNPCEPIHYVVNPEGAPDGWEDLLDDGIAEVSDAAGLKFEYDGTTGDRGFSDRIDGLGRAEPVLVGWADEDEVPKLAGDVAGLAGPVTQTRGGFGRYVTGMVVLDSDAFADLEVQPDAEAHQQAIVMHELGHLIGLDHVDDDHELMYESNLGRTTLGKGDRKGLAILGGVSCG
jgi:hypothetical protein